jgi:hypothetical protein
LREKEVANKIWARNRIVNIENEARYVPGDPWLRQCEVKAGDELQTRRRGGIPKRKKVGVVFDAAIRNSDENLEQRKREGDGRGRPGTERRAGMVVEAQREARSSSNH